MCFSNCMPSTNECYKFSPMPIHSSKDISNSISCTLRIRLAHRTFRINVDKTKSILSKRKFTSTIYLTVSKFLLFRCRSKRSSLCIVLKVKTSGAKPKDRSARLLNCNCASQSKQVSPAKTVSIFSLERFQETSGLIKISIVRPRPLWVESLSTAITTASSIRRSIRATAVPRKSNEETCISSIIRGPPFLTISQYILHICLDCFPINLLKIVPVLLLNREWRVAFRCQTANWLTLLMMRRSHHASRYIIKHKRGTRSDCFLVGAPILE
mmetsp:Transcript_28385/g.51423  ORF Transcript_28385/g.51423 Transcript_28385/m.51423 type:complete len:269 (+) Transcript_28385:710-1516(+)